MTISEVRADNRRREFRVRAEGRRLIVPYAKLRLIPSKEDGVETVFPDEELGLEGFTYRLQSGREDTIHMDAVLEINGDPDYLQELLLYRLTVEAKEGLKSSGIGKRQAARMLGTSPAQLYRLLDPSNSDKSLGQLLCLLKLVGRDVALEITDGPRRLGGASPPA